MAYILRGYERWNIHENGRIERPGLVRPSDAWRIVGAVTRDNFGNIVTFWNLDDILNLDIPWFFKNGKQKTFIRDLDHGTIREWRNVSHRIIRQQFIGATAHA